VSIYKTKKYVLAIDAPSYDAGPCTSGKRLSRRTLIGTSLNSEPASQANVFFCAGGRIINPKKDRKSDHGRRCMRHWHGPGRGEHDRPKRWTPPQPHVPFALSRSHLPTP
jgi:hypothetical protein